MWGAGYENRLCERSNSRANTPMKRIAVSALPHPSPLDLGLMSVTSVAALVLCVRGARATRQEGWGSWSCAMAVFVSSLAVRGWPGEIAGGRATLLRLLSCGTAVIAALGICRRLQGGLTAELALDAVPTIAAVSALSLVGTNQPQTLAADGLVTHIVYPAGYALLLLVSAELAVRVRRHGLTADMLAALGFVLMALAAMWVVIGLTLSAGWVVTVPDGLRSAGFALIALAGLRMARGAAAAPQGSGMRVSLVPALAVGTLSAIAVSADGTDSRLIYPLCVIGFLGFVFRLMLDRLTMRDLLEARDQAQSRYRALIERLPLIVYESIFDEYATTTFMSPQTTDTLGYTPDEWYENRALFPEILHPDDRDRAMAGLLDLTDHQDGVYVDEYRLIAKDGREVWIRDNARLVPDAQGRPMYWHGFMQDVTAQKQAEVEMRESDRRFREMLERVNLIAVMLDREGRITFANDHLLGLTGWSREQLLGRNWFETFTPSADSASREWFQAAVMTGTLAPSRESVILTRATATSWC
jgi:PAS domain S-box-containing protein